jgi:hypothetical protein
MSFSTKSDYEKEQTIIDFLIHKKNNKIIILVKIIIIIIIWVKIIECKIWVLI